MARRALLALLLASCGGPGAAVPSGLDSSVSNRPPDAPLDRGQSSDADALDPGGGGAGGRDAPGEKSCADDSLDKEGCTCSGSATRGCYPGDPSTNGKGACRPGQQTCGGPTVSTWGPCQGAVTPRPESCANGEDDDCNGLTDCEDPACYTVPGSSCKSPDGGDRPLDGVAGAGGAGGGAGTDALIPACPNGMCGDGRTCVDSPSACACGPTCVAGEIRICDTYCGLFQRCQPDGTWGACQFCFNDDSGACQCVDGPCHSHSDCPKGTYCDYWKDATGMYPPPTYGGCMPSYTTPTASSGGCKSDVDCTYCDPSTGLCFSHCWVEQGICVYNCHTHADCGPGLVCDLGVCIPSASKYRPFCSPTPPASCK